VRLLLEAYYEPITIKSGRETQPDDAGATDRTAVPACIHMLAVSDSVEPGSDDRLGDTSQTDSPGLERHRA
jgi:hypothetical protein